MAIHPRGDHDRLLTIFLFRSRAQLVTPSCMYVYDAECDESPYRSVCHVQITNVKLEPAGLKMARCMHTHMLAHAMIEVHAVPNDASCTLGSLEKSSDKFAIAVAIARMVSIVELA
jgi:hypothetical protein